MAREIVAWVDRRQERDWLGRPVSKDLAAGLGLMSPSLRLEAESGVTWRNIRRIITGESKTVTVDTADRLCMALDILLGDVYPDWYAEAGEEEVAA